jgi:thiamine phosphate synthase YjbQ (UPF0047 family)
MGRETVVAVTNGKLDLGTWEQIFYGDEKDHLNMPNWLTEYREKRNKVTICTNL